MATKIECNGDIIIDRGDKSFINFRCSNYKLEEGDSVLFSVDGLHVNKQVQDIQANGIACIDLDVVDTMHGEGTYPYTIRVITATGIDEKVLQGNYILK